MTTGDVSLLLKELIRIYESTVMLYWSGRAKYTELTMKLHITISWFSHTDNEIAVFYIKSWNICTYYVYFKTKKKHNYNRCVDPNILSASRLVHSVLRIYRISFFLLDGQKHNLLLLQVAFAVLCTTPRHHWTHFHTRILSCH